MTPSVKWGLLLIRVHDEHVELSSKTKIFLLVCVCVCVCVARPQYDTPLVGLGYHQGKDIVFRFIVEYGSVMDFGP